jgi:hypothetical protein
MAIVMQYQGTTRGEPTWLLEESIAKRGGFSLLRKNTDFKLRWLASMQPIAMKVLAVLFVDVTVGAK